MIYASHLIKTFYRAENRKKRVDFNAVDDISLEARPGEIVGILGPNGAGKTTLLRMLATLMRPTSGTVVITEQSPGKQERELKTPREMKQQIGYLSGNTRLYGRLTVRELLRFFAEVYGMTPVECEDRIQTVSEVLGLGEFMDNRIEKLSTGQTQRVSIARCIVHNPEIYIFDEPTLGLDIISSSRITEFMKQEKERGKTIIYSTHYMEEAEYLCDRILMLHRGKIICNESPQQLKADTGTDSMREAFYALIASLETTDSGIHFGGEPEERQGGNDR